MSVKSKFKTNSSLVNDGVWFDVCENVDKTKCRIRLRRTGVGNPLWSLAWRQHRAEELQDISSDKDRELMAEVFADAIVVDWEHMQTEEDGKDVPFTREAVVKLLADADWLEFRSWIREKADSLAPFQDKREEEVKN